MGNNRAKGFGAVIALIVLGTFTGGCEEFMSTMTVTEAREYVFWITASEDTYASCGRTAGCEEGDLTFGNHGSLVVANGPLGHKRSYVNFVLPGFPEGTTIDRAKMELYHAGKNEDGTPDDITMNVAALFGENWNESTLSWNDRPDIGASTPTGAIPLYLKSQAWSPTGNMKEVISRAVSEQSNFQGFVVNLGQRFFNRHVEKGFLSANYFQRERDDLDRAPRLLMKVTLPEGSSFTDIDIPFLASGSNEFGSATVRYLFVQGTDFPAEWEVSPYGGN